MAEHDFAHFARVSRMCEGNLGQEILGQGVRSAPDKTHEIPEDPLFHYTHAYPHPTPNPHPASDPGW